MNEEIGLWLEDKMIITGSKTTSEFICPFDTLEFDTFAALQSHIKAIHQETRMDINIVKLTVNGKEHILRVETNSPLRDVLRKKLGLTSIKDMCGGYGACGSCTVIMNGRPVLSCTILSIECDGAVIETAEGIADANHALVESYIMNWTVQCGYCTPGFIVTAKALLDRNPNPTGDEIREALGGNICRCGSYPAHIKAILEAAEKKREGK